MKVEKISDLKVKITLSYDELKVRNISLAELEKNSDIAKSLFLDLISETELDTSFLLDHSQLYIEASSDNDNHFVVTITKIDDIVDIENFDILDNHLLNDKKNLSSKNHYSNIYIFKSLDDFIACSYTLNKNKLFYTNNSLYMHNNLYYLILSKSSVRSSKFKETNLVLSEYSINEVYSDDLDILIMENYTMILKNNAINSLCNL